MLRTTGWELAIFVQSNATSAECKHKIEAYWRSRWIRCEGATVPNPIEHGGKNRTDNLVLPIEKRELVAQPGGTGNQACDVGEPRPGMAGYIRWHRNRRGWVKSRQSENRRKQ